MNRRELIKATIAHEHTDRVPYFIQMTQKGRDAFSVVYENINTAHYIDNDVIRVHAPWWEWYDLGEDWHQPDVPTSPAKVRGVRSYESFFDKVAQLRENSDKYILVMIFGSHFEKAYFARSLEYFLMDLVAEPEFARDLLGKIIEKNMVMLENILACDDIDGVLLGSDWGTQIDLIMSPHTWEEMIRPGEQREYDLIHSYGKDVWVHSCGNVVKILPSLIEMGVDVLNPVQPEAMDIAKLKKDFGDKITFWGGVGTQQVLPNGTPEEVKKESRAVRELMAQDGGYIFGPSQDIQDDVPPENIAALIEVAQEGK